MQLNPVLESIRGGLIVSCQAQESDPLYGEGMMTCMAVAAKAGGAVGIRANGYEDIYSIKRTTDLPVIGIVKQTYEGSDVYITPTEKEVDDIARAGADIIAVEATKRLRPDKSGPLEFIARVKKKYPHLLVMADVSTFDEAVVACQAGADVVASTMSGYTPYSPQLNGPDFLLLEQMNRLGVPVIAEGRVQTPEQASRCLELGVLAVVVGSAITRPQEITRSFVDQMHIVQNRNNAEKKSS